jgi:hypothetical protein
MNNQRPLNSASPLHPRNGAPKRLTDTATTPGMTRQTSSDLHPFAHGQAVNDEPLQKTYEGKEVPIHTAMTSRADRGQHIPGEANRVLSEASRLGRPKEIDDKQNGRALDGGSRPVTSQD